MIRTGPSRDMIDLMLLVLQRDKNQSISQNKHTIREGMCSKKYEYFNYFYYLLTYILYITLILYYIIYFTYIM